MRIKRPLVSMFTVKHCVMCIGLVFVLTSFITNIAFLLTFWSLYSMLSDIIHSPSSNIFDRLAVSPHFQDMVHAGKEGGFSSLIENIVGRLYIESLMYPHSSGSSKSDQLRRVSRVGIDVSGSGEALYIYQRMMSRPRGRWKQLVVDIGANDGMLSSNSYNFIQWGWSAILVEPQEYQLTLAKRNIQRLVKTSKDQYIQYVAAAIGDRDGHVQFTLSSDIVSMESHVAYSQREPRERDGATVTVPCYTVKTFASKFNVPKYFGILSIDAEGMGTKILYQWIQLGYRPAYILHEELNDPEDIQVTAMKLEAVGYIYLTKRGWNHIFEYSPYNSSQVL